MGVEDHGRVTGARPRHGDAGTDSHRLTALIANRTQPSITPRIRIGKHKARKIVASTSR
jgi:ATP-dependent DNA helicase RecG